MTFRLHCYLLLLVCAFTPNFSWLLLDRWTWTLQKHSEGSQSPLRKQTNEEPLNSGATSQISVQKNWAVLFAFLSLEPLQTSLCWFFKVLQPPFSFFALPHFPLFLSSGMCVRRRFSQLGVCDLVHPIEQKERRKKENEESNYYVFGDSYGFFSFIDYGSPIRVWDSVRA